MSKPIIFVSSNLAGNFTQCLEKAVPGLLFKNISCRNLQTSETDLLELKSDKCQILVADPNIIAHFMYDLPHLKWAQSTFAGVDPVVRKYDKTKPHPGFILTRFGGVFGVPMAEYVLGQIIARERQFFKMYDYQKIAKWDTSAFRMYRPLFQLSIVFIGLGDIGREVAKMCKNFGMTVKALVRKIPSDNDKLTYVDEYREVSDGAAMASVFSASDYICTVLPATQETDRLLEKNDVLKACKDKQTVLINIGRGNVIGEQALVQALKEKWVGGAILDVFSQEPLPSDSELWAMDNVTISPHTATQSFDWQIAEVFKMNYEKYIKGEKMDYCVDFHRGY